MPRQALKNPAKLAEDLGQFLRAARRPALLEADIGLLPLESGSCSIEAKSHHVQLHAWDTEHNVVRRVVGCGLASRTRLELVVEKFGGKRQAVLLVDLAAPGHDVYERRSERLRLRERLRALLHRQWPDWRLAELSSEPDLRYSLSPVYPRALLTQGTAGVAVILADADPPSATGVLSFGLIWLDYLRRRERTIAIEGLIVLTPEGSERPLGAVWPLLNRSAGRFELYCYTPDGICFPADPADFGNVDTRVEPCSTASPASLAAAAPLMEEPGVESVELRDGSLSLRVQGLEFARAQGAELLYGMGRRAAVVRGDYHEARALARGLASVRHARASNTHIYWRQTPELWLESVVRSHCGAIDPSLRKAPLYGQVFSSWGREGGILDLLGIEHSGRAVVLELKASADVELPLQALEYWLRVRRHLRSGELEAAGYFQGHTLQTLPPRLVLVAPALEFHPSTETLLRFFSPEIEIERVGLGPHWREDPQVVFRLRGAERPA